MFAFLLLASPLSSLGDLQTCADVPGPVDLPGEGMRWVETPNCQNCVADACLGCFNSSTSTCARCVYDPISCGKTVGETECSRLALGASLRKQTCKGTSFPFIPDSDEGFPYGLCPGNDIADLNKLRDMTIEEARNVCAGYRDASKEGTDTDGFCKGFMWTTGSSAASAVTEGSPLACPSDPPAGGIMWRDAPNCVGCVADACFGCQNGSISNCARCVYDRAACYASTTGEAECNRFILGAQLRSETDCSGPHPTNTFKITFKSEWKPNKKPGDCQAVGSASPAFLSNVAATDEHSIRPAFTPYRRHTVISTTRTVSQTNPDAVWDGDINGINAWSYCPGNDPPSSPIDAYLSTSTLMKHDSGCMLYVINSQSSSVVI